MNESNNSAQQPVEINCCKYCDALIHPLLDFCDMGCQAKYEKKYQSAAQQPVKTAEFLQAFRDFASTSIERFSNKPATEAIVAFVQEWLDTQFREGQQSLSEIERNQEPDLVKLYNWIMGEKRPKAETCFTAGWARNCAREIQYRISGHQGAYREALEAQREYIEFLDKAYSDAFSMAHAHGYRETQDGINKGVELRKRIAEALSSPALTSKEVAEEGCTCKTEDDRWTCRKKCENKPKLERSSSQPGKEEAAAIELLKEYEQWEADLISNDYFWWPKAPKDSLSGKVYEKMLELQQKRNEILTQFKHNL